MEKSKNYYVGLDIGSSSVGWSVTDENYKLERRKGKTAHGSVIFDEASDAKEFRMHRTSKRRTERRKYRISLLNTLLVDEVKKVDADFFKRLQYSNYVPEDRENHIKFDCPLFKERAKEKDFYKHFPTVWHLRAALIDGDEYALSDIRFIYLALHHIIKYRGNFLIEGKINTEILDKDTFESINKELEKIYESLKEKDDDNDYSDVIPMNSFNEIVQILECKENNKTKKSSELKNIFNCVQEIQGYIDLIISLMVGGEYSLSKIANYDCEKGMKITFASGFDDNIDEYESIMGDDIALVYLVKKVYDFFNLKETLQGEEYISKAFCKLYQTHADQLRKLKEIVKTLDLTLGNRDKKRIYYEMFHNNGVKNNYSSYINKDTKEPTGSDIKGFNKYVKDILEKNKNIGVTIPGYDDILELAGQNELLPTISVKSSSVIPHQLHEQELTAILEKAKEKYGWLYKMKEKLLALFKYRIPYYFGPLNTESKYSHIKEAKKDEKETVTPWNIDEVIDKDKAKKNFMESLTNNCQYLPAKSVLPKCSVIFQDYVNLNRLNTMRINGELISQDVKQDVFDNIICQRPKTTISALSRYLLDHFEVYRNDGVSISGLNEKDDFINTSRYALQNVFDFKNSDLIEDIIFIMTIYTDNKKDAIDIINEKYKINEQQKKALKSVSFKGWAPFSKELLVGLKTTDDNDVEKSIMDLLYENTINFQQIIFSDEYGFKKQIENCKTELSGNSTPQERVAEIIEARPPFTRRSITQALKVVKEIVKTSGCAPQKIMIEVSRSTLRPSEKIKATKNSRKEQLTGFLEVLKKDEQYAQQAKNCLTELGKDGINNDSLKGRRLYFYFAQLGMDVYTGNKIDINDVINGNNYDLDHIIPQCLIKDDSLDNLVLVSRDSNQKIKGSRYPLPESIRNNEKIRKLWKCLHKKNKTMFSDKKYNNLIRNTPITNSELDGFVSRQINELNVANTAIRDCLHELYPDTKLILTKAQYAHGIRQELGIPKIRDLNDCHHAVDAYLNIISGDILDREFGDIGKIKAKEKRIEKYSSTHPGEEMPRNVSFNMDDYLIGQAKQIKDLILANAYRHDFLVTYRYNYNESEFYKANSTSHLKNTDSLTPVHTNPNKGLSDVTKYGGYNCLSNSYFFIGTVIKKGVKKRILVPVPVLYTKLAKNDDALIQMLKDKNDDKTLQINPKIRINSKQEVLIEGNHYLLVRRNKKVVRLLPIDQIFLDQKDSAYLYGILKQAKENPDKLKVFDKYEYCTDKDHKNLFSITPEKNKELYEKFIQTAKLKKYDYYTVLNEFRGESGDKVLEQFGSKNILDQIYDIDTIMHYFTRSFVFLAEGDKRSIMEKSLTVLFDNDVYAIYNSTTALYSKVLKL